MSKLTERDVLQLERIKERLKDHCDGIRSAQRALRSFAGDEYLSNSPVDLGFELEVDVMVDDLDLFLVEINEAIQTIDDEIEEYDERN